MADIDLDTLSLADLKTLQKEVTNAIEAHDQRRRRDARAALEATARELGYTLADLAAAGGKGGRKARAPQKVKYRHPENASLTWTGRGRQPLWVKDALEAGTPLEALLV